MGNVESQPNKVKKYENTYIKTKIQPFLFVSIEIILIQNNKNYIGKVSPYNLVYEEDGTKEKMNLKSQHIIGRILEGVIDGSVKMDSIGKPFLEAIKKENFDIIDSGNDKIVKTFFKYNGKKCYLETKVIFAPEVKYQLNLTIKYNKKINNIGILKDGRIVITGKGISIYNDINFEEELFIQDDNDINLFSELNNGYLIYVNSINEIKIYSIENNNPTIKQIIQYKNKTNINISSVIGISKDNQFLLGNENGEILYYIKKKIFFWEKDSFQSVKITSKIPWPRILNFLEFENINRLFVSVNGGYIT